MILTTGAPRGCGTRQQGGVYACCGLSPHGTPVEEFLFDPPLEVDELTVKSIGVTLFERDGVLHVLDHVGSVYYASIADYVEEVKRLGLSRRLELSAEEYAQITPESRLLHTHERAFVENWKELRPIYAPCPKGLHDANEEFCAACWWATVEGGELLAFANETGLEVAKMMPSFAYTAWMPKDGFEGEFRLGLFASFPISHIEVIEDPDGGEHERKKERLADAQVPVAVVSQ